MANSITNSLAPRSKAVTNLAIATLILGGLRLILSVLAIWFLLNVMTDGVQPKPRPPGAARDFGDIDITPLLALFVPLLALVGIAVAIVSVVAGLLLVIAGMGLWQRRRFSRELTIILGTLGGMLAMLYGYALVSEASESGWDLAADPTQLAVLLLGLLMHGGYCAFVFVVLLNRKSAAEFA
jgi:hypothetical protein